MYIYRLYKVLLRKKECNIQVVESAPQKKGAQYTGCRKCSSEKRSTIYRLYKVLPGKKEHNIQVV